MKKRLFIISLLTAFSLVACNGFDDDFGQSVEEQGGIALNIEGIGAGSRMVGSMADEAYESAITHLDILFFNDGADDENSTLAYSERINVTEGATIVTLGVKPSDFTANAEYRVYVIANASATAESFAVGALANVEELKEMKQLDGSVHLSGLKYNGIPSHFLMDGMAYLGTGSEPATGGPIVIFDGDKGKKVEMSVVLRRAAAKVVVKLTEGANMNFSNELTGSSPGYYMRNLPYTTKIVAGDGSEVVCEDLRITAEAWTDYAKWVRDGENEITGLEITAYVYSHSWDPEDNSVFSQATNLLVDIPALYNDPVNGVVTYPKNYYQIPLTKEFKFERNHYYEVSATVNAPGAEDFSEPVEVQNLSYSVYDWTERVINVGGEIGPFYLKVNRDTLDIHNITTDSKSLMFTSSSPITITIDSVSYFDKFGTSRKLTTQQINAENVRATTAAGAISGNITINSNIPDNNTIRYIRLTVANQDGQKESVLVRQYPLTYIVNIQGWYSYREDFRTGTNSATTINNVGSKISGISLGSWNSATSTYSYTYNRNSGFFRSKVVREKYSPEHRQDSYKGRSDIDYYYYSSYGNSIQYGDSEDPANARMYHVRTTASSEEYNIGLPKTIVDPATGLTITAPGEDNARLVSPSFIIASRLGTVTPGDMTNANQNNATEREKRRLAIARHHAANYVEVAEDGTVYKDWRLPTDAELKIIMSLQGTQNESADAIDFLLSGTFYISGNGEVYNENNIRNDNVNNWGIRCVHDVLE